MRFDSGTPQDMPKQRDGFPPSHAVRNLPRETLQKTDNGVDCEIWYFTDDAHKVVVLNSLITVADACEHALRFLNGAPEFDRAEVLCNGVRRIIFPETIPIIGVPASAD
jgi:hypothetical protein